MTKQRLNYIVIFTMTIKENFFTLFPKILNENEFSALIGVAIKQTGKITATFKIKEDEYDKLFGYGRDRTDNVLNSLVEKKFIKREQKRDVQGKFTFNEITIITNLVK